MGITVGLNPYRGPLKPRGFPAAAAIGMPVGTAATDAVVSESTAQLASVDTPEPGDGVAADQLAGTDKPPTVEAWATLASTGVAPKPVAAAGPATLAKPAAAPVTAWAPAAAAAAAAGALLTAWNSNTAAGMLFMAHHAAVFTTPLMALVTNGKLRGLGMVTAAVTGEAMAATA